MLFRLRKAQRIKATITLTVVYALCVLAPSVAFALAGNDHITHCLTEDHGLAAPSHHATTTHTHADGTVHAHHDAKAHVHADGSMQEPTSHHASSPRGDDDGKNHGTTCCGLFSVVGISWHPTFSFGTFSVATLSFLALQDALSGRGPERINRPPIA